VGEVPNSMNAVENEFQEEWPVELNQTEALNGFMIYLTQRERDVVGSVGLNVAVIVSMLRDFCEANGFDPVRVNYKESLLFPS
jgi:hypothetical protein